MNKTIKKIMVSLVVASVVTVSSAVAFAETVGFGITLPSTGYNRIATAEKQTTSRKFTLHIKNVGNSNKYNFWSFLDGRDPQQGRITSMGEGQNTGTKYTWFDEDYQYSRVGLAMKTGTWVYTPMWIEGSFTPN